MDRKHHWEGVYKAKPPDEVSWFQRTPVVSLDLIQRVAPDKGAAIIDVGAGASVLVDGLIAAGYSNVVVLELSEKALELARARLGPMADQVKWIEGDVLTGDLPEAAFDVWHDRALFHFMTDPPDRVRYVAQVRRSLRPGGHLVIGTFAHDGPATCSGLPVARYRPEALCWQFGPGFTLVDSVRELHETPSGGHQAFVYALCRYEPSGAGGAW